jgi:forespore regulator of the sigma-K checkpoint
MSVSNPVNVVMEKQYVCGKETIALGMKNPDELIKYMMDNPRITAVMSAQGDLMLIEQIDDLSPACKNNAYIGVDGEGNLTLFEMETGEKKAVRTFFQLNIHQMESSLPQDTIRQIYTGIKISDIDEFNSVLSTFSDYAVDEKTEKVMKPSV